MTSVDVLDQNNRNFGGNEYYYLDANEYLCCGRYKFWCVTEPTGIVCAFFTWLLILYAIIVVCYVTVLPNPDLTFKILNLLAFCSLAFLAMCSHLRAMFSNPGAVSIDAAPRDKAMALRLGLEVVECRKCGCVKPERAHHCSICHRCIRRMDHHCPWINNCVGEDNIKFFVLFNFYIALMSSYALILSVLKYKECNDKAWKKTTPFEPSINMILLLSVILESLVFGIFTIIIFSIQMGNILSDRTYIEKLKKNEVSPEENTRFENFQNVFGVCCLKWFSPFSPPNGEYD